MFMLFPKISSLLTNFTDHHSHILPGVDDGVKKMEVSLKILERYEQLGIAEVWCTPHIMEDIPNTTEGLQARFAELCEAYQGPIKLNLAAEYMMDALFEERLEQGDLLKLGHENNQVLVETSYFTPPMDMDKILRRIKQKGLYPVLAHPERYVYMNKERYTALKDDGIVFQLNLSSLAGAYGSEAKDKALWILKKNYYNLIGSDLHSMRNIDYWSTRAPRALKQLLRAGS
jgi:tyrosine-protein phosphatase YwqE